MVEYAPPPPFVPLQNPATKIPYLLPASLMGSTVPAN
jgi:hypothetical protein